MLYDTDENTLFKAGQVLYLTAGEYSSYCVVMIARVLKDFDARDYVLQEPYMERLDKARMLAEKVIEEIDAVELRISGY